VVGFALREAEDVAGRWEVRLGYRYMFRMGVGWFVYGLFERGLQ